MKYSKIIFATLFVLAYSQIFAQGHMVKMLDHYGHYMYDVDANDQNEVWTAGNNQIMYSSNNGDDWIDINFPFPNAQLQHISAQSADKFIVAGKALHRTDDGGATWETFEELFQIKGIFQFDQTVFISRAEDDKSIQRSDDEGKNWKVIAPTSVVRAKTISFLNATTGFCSDDIGTIYKTTDAGENWTIINSNDFSEEIKFITFRNETEGYLIQEKNFYQSTDGGASWELLNEDISTQVKALFVSSTEVITIDSRFKAYDFDNNNLTTIIDKEDYDLIWSNDFEQTSNFQFVSGNGFVFRKPINDVWNDWVDLTPGPNIGFDNIAFSGNKMALSGPQRTQFSDDNGQTFTQHQSPGFTYFEDLQILPNGHIYIATNALRKSEDNGATWEFVIGGTQFNAFDNDNIIRHHNGSIFRTDDAGLTWDSLYQVQGSSIRSIHFYDDNFGWLFGTGGIAHRTTDGGETWEVFDFDSSAPTLGQFVSPQVGFGLRKYSSTFYKTADGGDTWETSGIDQYIEDIIDLHFEDELHGWISGVDDGQGMILETFDGGDTWSIFQLGIDEFMRISKNEDTGDLWAIGRSAQLYKFAICDNLSPTLTISNDRITCDEIGSSYKWFYENEFLVETEENFIDVVALGDYAVRVVGDENCVSEFSPSLNVVSKVDELKQLSFANIHPNPNAGSFSVTVSNDILVENVLFYTSAGQEVPINYSTSTQGFDIQATDLVPGIYFLKLHSKQGFDVARVFIK